MQCCGDPFSVGSAVSWTVMRPDRDYLASVLVDHEGGRVTDAEEHHGGDEGRESWELTGTVRSIEAVVCRYEPHDGSDSRTLYPVAGDSDHHLPLRGRRWESDIYGPEDDLHFVGYVVGLDVPE